MNEDEWCDYQYECIYLEYSHPSGGQFCSNQPKENKQRSGRIQNQCEACRQESCPQLSEDS